MRFHLLVSKDMEPVPETITVVDNYGEVYLMGAPLEMYRDGKHMIVEGSEEAIKDWLRPFEGVWVGDGPPILQQFLVMHIR